MSVGPPPPQSDRLQRLQCRSDLQSDLQSADSPGFWRLVAENASALAGTDKVFERYRTAGFADTTVAAADEGYGAISKWLPADKSATILDLGCGGGEFLEFLRRQGFTNTEGIDYSVEQIARCRQRGLENLTHATDSQAYVRGRKGKLAVVVMNDVLEHIPKTNIIPELETIRDSLAPGGSLIIKVPNAANVFGIVARYLDFTHEVAFTEHSLQQVLVAADFPKIEIEGLPVRLKLKPKRLVYWSMNRVYMSLHRAAYVAAVGEDAPRILNKLLLARAQI